MTLRHVFNYVPCPKASFKLYSHEKSFGFSSPMSSFSVFVLVAVLVVVLVVVLVAQFAKNVQNEKRTGRKNLL